jgi:hypothetical protein
MCTETKDARVHCTILNDHTNQRPTPPNTTKRALPVQRGHPLRTQQCARPAEKPTGRCLVLPLFLEQPHFPPPEPHARVRYSRPSTTNRKRTEHAPVNTPGRRCPVKLLRKEVIQPHLPVRLPCYDFVPIASPTFDRSPPDGLGHGLRVLPTFVT